MPPTLPWDLEDWLTNEGDRVVRIIAKNATVSASDLLLYEFWLFDTEQRNGGVSQYFANRGLVQWDKLRTLASSALQSFPPFAAKVNEVVVGKNDLYEAIIESGVDLDDWYMQNQLSLVTELRSAVRPAA